MAKRARVLKSETAVVKELVRRIRQRKAGRPRSSDIADILASLDYAPEDDSWNIDGRRTYSHDENAGRRFLGGLVAALKSLGWRADDTRLRALRNFETGEMIEIEPGGTGITGHLLHHMKAEVVE